MSHFCGSGREEQGEQNHAAEQGKADQCNSTENHEDVADCCHRSEFLLVDECREGIAYHQMES